ncbi:MAG: hypothetical protein OJF58_000548 [Enhydrobacter sp.]|nr:MAG: hypothetical protein OJF58_000548 [Enhydrobacter sp.]
MTAVCQLSVPSRAQRGIFDQHRERSLTSFGMTRISSNATGRAQEA